MIASPNCPADSFGPREIIARGINSSLIHIDWMIGSGKIDVDGITPDGTASPLMRSGEWTTEV